MFFLSILDLNIIIIGYFSENCIEIGLNSESFLKLTVPSRDKRSFLYPKKLFVCSFLRGFLTVNFWGIFLSIFWTIYCNFCEIFWIFFEVVFGYFLTQLFWGGFKDNLLGRFFDIFSQDLKDRSTCIKYCSKNL